MITHEYDELLRRRGLLRRWTSDSLLYDILAELQRRNPGRGGKRSLLAAGRQSPHVDAT